MILIDFLAVSTIHQPKKEVSMPDSYRGRLIESCEKAAPAKTINVIREETLRALDGKNTKLVRQIREHPAAIVEVDRAQLVKELKSVSKAELTSEETPEENETLEA